MTVKELVERLSEYPEDMRVCVCTDYTDGTMDYVTSAHALIDAEGERVVAVL